MVFRFSRFPVLMSWLADETVIKDDILFSQEVSKGTVYGLCGKWQAVELCQVMAMAVAEQLEDLLFAISFWLFSAEQSVILQIALVR
jgi:hypothetical protein